MGVLVRPPSTGWMREEDFPSLVTPVADESEFTSVAFATSSTLFMSADFRPKDVARGFALGPFIPDRGLSSISPSRYVTDWGVCPSHSVTHQKCRAKDDALRANLQRNTSAGSRPIVDFIKALYVKNRN